MKKQSTKSFFAALAPIFLFLVNLPVFAQQPIAVGGKVTDAKGVPIPGATVRIFSAEGMMLSEMLTDLDGSFAFEALQPGFHRITVEIVGFIGASKGPIDSGVVENRYQVFQLEAPPRPPRPRFVDSPVAKQQAPDTETSSFQTAEVTDLPGLNQYQQSLIPTDSDATAPASRGDNVLLISGNTATLDGGNLSDPQFRQQIIDVVRQMGFQIEQVGPGGEGSRGGIAGGAPGEMIVGGMGARGGMPGGGMGPGGGGPIGIVGLAGRGGRGANFRQPKVEGNINETYSNSALNARSYSLTGNTLPKPVQIQNNFGITLGGAIPFLKAQASSSQRGALRRGPVSQPGWTFSYNGSRSRSAQDILTTVPTDLERSGDFSQTFIQTLVTDPLTGRKSIEVRPVQLRLDPNNPSLVSSKVVSISPIAAGLLRFYPSANIPCAPNTLCVNNYALERSLITTSDQFQVGVTGLRLTARDNLGLNYSLRRGSSLNAAIFPGLDSTRTNFAQNVGISGMHMFQQRIFANWRVTLNRTRTESTNAFAYTENVEGALGITGASPDPINWGPPTIAFTNYGGVSLAAPILNRNQTLTVSAGLNKVASKHSIQVGGDISWAQRNSYGDSNGRGTFTFNGYATGYDFADFLVGRPYSTSRSFVDPNVNPYGSSVYLRNRTWNLYIMDNWRVRSNLTLNVGIRYEYVGPTFEKYNRLAGLDVAPGFAAEVLVLPNVTGGASGQHFSRSLVSPDRNNWAPRVGVAWKPVNRLPIVIRAGYGISYNAGGLSTIANRLRSQPPFAVNQNFTSDQLTLQNGFPTSPGSLPTFAVDPNYKAAYAQQWNLDIQAQISRLYVLNVAYNGIKGTGLDTMLAPPAHNKIDGKDIHYIYQTNGASSIYHGLNVQLSRRFSHGFNLSSSYTLSKSIDNTSGGATVVQDYTNLAAERALSSQDQRHNFQTNFTYELPFGQNRMFLAGASTKVLNLVSGWTISGNLILASGSPVTPRYSGAGTGSSGAAFYNSLRPDATGQTVSIPRGDRTVQRFFNTAAFAIPSGPYGNAGRNTITGPGNNVVNLSIRKGFRLDENNRRLDLSWQIQNLFNHPSWASVSTTVNALNFGQVTGVRPMRSMTLNLRIRF